MGFNSGFKGLSCGDTLFNDAGSTAAFEGNYNIELLRMRDEAARTNVKWMP